MNSTNKVSCANRLKALDFAMIETGLFLNTHPEDAKALEYFNKLSAERKDAYKNCNTMTLFDGKTLSSWDWVTTPWPWEMED